MRRKLSTFILFVTTALAGLTAFGTVNAFNPVLSAKGLCSHVGNHYVAKSKTCTAPGNEEFWVCCKCNEKFLDRPATGSWSDLGQYSGVLEDSHIAYIAPSHEYGPDENSTIRIGSMVKRCSDCGDIESSETIMTNDDIDLTKRYGADGEGFVVSDQRLAWIKENVVITMLLPRVEMSAYKEIKFSFFYFTLWGRIGFSESNSFGGYGDGWKSDGSRGDKSLYSFDLNIIQKANGLYEATLSYPYKGETFRTIITDQAILSGGQSFSLYLSYGAYSSIFLEKISVSADYSHNHVYSYITKDVIGTSYHECSICGDSDSSKRISQSEDVDYSKDLYGANIEYIGSYGWNKNDSADAPTWASNTKVSSTSEAIRYKPGIEGANYRLLLPKVNYYKYSEVDFTISARGYEFYYGIKFENEYVWNEGTPKSISASFTGTIKIVLNNKTSLYVELISDDLKDGLTISATITDQQIIKGEVSLPMYFSNAACDPVSISKPTLYTHEHVEVGYSESIGGTVAVKCSLCDEILSTRSFADSDIDYNASTFGASGKADFLLSVDNNELLFKGANHYARCSTFVIPHINFNQYSSLVFDFKNNFYYGLGFDDFAYDNGYFQVGKVVPNNPIDLQLVLSANNGVILARLTDGVTTIEKTYTDSAIYDGTKGIEIYGRTAFNSDYLRIFKPKILEIIDGVIVPKISARSPMDITTYSSPAVNSSNAMDIYSDIKAAGFTKISELLNGRDYQCNNVYTTINNYESVGVYDDQAFETVKTAIDNTVTACYQTSIAGINAANSLGLKYEALVGTLYDIPNKCSISNSTAKAIFDYAWGVVKDIYGPSLDKINSFNIFDEPTTSTDSSKNISIARLSTISASYSRANIGKDGFINLLPLYSTSYNDIINYRNYIKFYLNNIKSNLNSNICSIDHYAQNNTSPLTSKASLLNYYIVADEVSKLNDGTKLAAFIHTLTGVESDKAAIKSANDIRFQMYPAMLFGATNIAYYEYYRSINDGIYGLLDRSLQKTVIYDYAKEVNKEAIYLSNVCNDFSWKGVMACGAKADFASLSAIYSYLSNGGTSLQSVSNSSGDGSYLPTLVGCMNDGTRDGFFVMNYRNPQEDTAWGYDVTLKFNKSYNYCLKFKDGTKDVVPVQDNSLTFGLSGDHAAFIVPLSI